MPAKSIAPRDWFVLVRKWLLTIPLAVLIVLFATLLSFCLFTPEAAIARSQMEYNPEAKDQGCCSGSQLAPGDENWDDRFGSLGTNGSVNATAVRGNDVYVGGLFSMAGGTAVNRIARWNTVTKRWYPLGSGVGGEGFAYVEAIAVHGNDVYVGGNFTTAGGVIANRIARWNTITNRWYPLGSGIDDYFGTVHTIAVHGNDVYVGGHFTRPGGNIARWNSDSNQWYSLGHLNHHQDNARVYALAVGGSDVYVGGLFTTAGGVIARNIARWNSVAGQWYPLSSGVRFGESDDGRVRAIAVRGSDVYVGGYFTAAGEMDAASIARWNNDTGQWYPLGSGLSGGPGYGSNAYAIAVRGNDVYVGGTFTTAGGVSANRIARWSNSKGQWYPLGSGLSGGPGYTNAIGIRANGVYAGGAFRMAGGRPSNYFGLWHIP